MPTLSEKFKNPTEKSQKDVKSIPLTHIHGRSLSWYRHFNKKWRGYASSIDPSFSLNFAAEEITPSYVENICSENLNLLNSFIFLLKIYNSNQIKRPVQCVNNFNWKRCNIANTIKLEKFLEIILTIWYFLLFIFSL